MKRVITVSLSENFIRVVAEMIVKEYVVKGQDIGRLAFIFEGKRPALFLKKELARKIKRGFIPPVFFSIDEFIEYIVSRKEKFSRTNDLESCYLVYNLVKKFCPQILDKREGFAQFIPWSREILSFIDQLDHEDVSPGILDNIRLNASIGYDVPESINVLLTRLINLRQEYHRCLEEKNNYSRGLLYLRASRIIGDLEFPEFDRIFFCNFFYAHKTQERIIKNIYESGKGVLVFQGGREWPVLDDFSRRLSLSLDASEPSPAGYQLSVISGFDSHSQVSIVRDILSKLKDPQKSVIVLPDPDKMIPLLSEIAYLNTDFNVSMGYPMERSAVYSLFKCIARAQATKKDDTYYSKDYLGVLSHPLIKNLKMIGGDPAVTRILIHKIEEIITGKENTVFGGSLFVNILSIEGSDEVYDLALQTMKGMDVQAASDELRGILSDLHNFLFNAWEGTVDFSGFTRNMDILLKMLIEKSPLNRYPVNIKIMEKIFAIVEDLKNVSFAEESFTREEIFKIFENKIENEMISFSGSPLKGLQILGALETRALNFENVIVLDVNENVLPSLKVNEPLIPREVMLRLGMNHLEKEEEIQRYQFRRLISSAKNVYLVFEESARKERSRFIEELIWERQKKEKRFDVMDIPQAVFNIAATAQKQQIQKSSHEVEFLRGMSFSPSGIDMYLGCPLRFYYHYVLGLREDKDILDEPEGSEVGTFIHEFLQEAFTPFLYKKLLIDRRFEKSFLGLLDKKFSAEFGKKMKSDSFLLKEILLFRMKKFLDNEKKRDVAMILGLEKTFSEVIECNGLSVRLKAKIDRIDRLADGSILVVDYKTGTADVPFIEEFKEGGELSRQYLRDTIRSFQLPVYLYCVQQEYNDARVNACLYSVRDLQRNYGLAKLFKNESQYADKDVIMRDFKEALGFIIEEIFDPDVPFEADNSQQHKCGYCAFSALCNA